MVQDAAAEHGLLACVQGLGIGHLPDESCHNMVSSKQAAASLYDQQVQIRQLLSLGSTASVEGTHCP